MLANEYNINASFIEKVQEWRFLISRTEYQRRLRDQRPRTLDTESQSQRKVKRLKVNLKNGGYFKVKPWKFKLKM